MCLGGHSGLGGSPGPGQQLGVCAERVHTGRAQLLLGVSAGCSAAPVPLEGPGWGVETPVCGDTTFLFQAEIVKRLSAICTQMMPFLTQEVRVEAGDARWAARERANPSPA